ncbi:MAG: response regulator [Acidobacteria bacterium]|nr:response regulator [Acidobacteriota bacterium]MBI3263710.1 response regulator [Acidobacteriota bacterium]
MVPRATPGDPALVLIVEDDRDNREACAEYLRFSGFHVEEARDGIEALEKGLDLLPDLILMDLAIPDVDGCEVTRRLRRNPKTRHIPIVALTALVMPTDVQRALEAGCNAFIEKPCHPDQLLIEIQRQLKQREKLVH